MQRAGTLQNKSHSIQVLEGHLHSKITIASSVDFSVERNVCGSAIVKFDTKDVQSTLHKVCK